MARDDAGYGIAVFRQVVCAPRDVQIRAQQDEAPTADLVRAFIPQPDGLERRADVRERSFQRAGVRTVAEVEQRVADAGKIVQRVAVGQPCVRQA